MGEDARSSSLEASLVFLSKSLEKLAGAKPSSEVVFIFLWPIALFFDDPFRRYSSFSEGIGSRTFHEVNRSA